MGGRGSGGRNRKPADLHRMSGTFRPDRHGQTATARVLDMRPGHAPVAVPSWVTKGLGPAGRRFVRQTAERYEVGAEEWQLVQLAARQLDRAEHVAAAMPKATADQLPRLVRIERQASQQFAALVKQLSLEVES